MKETVYANERNSLCARAFLSENTAGRLKALRPCPVRTDFMRDRDRIIHSKSFRRLMHKMQVFLAPEGDHYRTRLTHTLEVTQIARTLARALRLNEDLTEAAALGHDLGHTPFGHSGERALNRLCPNGFRHNEQSLRVADKLENLNLTVEVRDGMLNHSGDGRASTLEGQLIKFADRIAYINHDIDDACRAGILSLDDIPKELLDTLGRGHSERINRMVTSVITASAGKPEIAFTPEIGEATMQLRKFLFDHVYTNPLAKSEDKKAQELLVRLFEYYVKHPEEMPDLYYRNTKTEPVERCVCDFVGGMTDRYAIDRYTELFIPQVWRGRQI